MTLNTAAWAIDGATMSSDLAREAVYASTGGAEGVISVGDLKVIATSPASDQVQIKAGGGLVLNRSNGASNQSYTIDNDNNEDELVTVATTGAGGGGRHDLVCIRVRDPQYAPWPAPPSGEEATYPYVDSFIISDVPANTKSFAELGLNYSAIAVARLDLPANNAVVTDGQIVDLRKVAIPRTHEEIFHSATTVDDLLNGTANTYEAFPNGAYMDIDVPTWATTCVVSGYIEGLRLQSAGSGKLRVAFSDGGASEATNVNEGAPSGGVDRRTYNVGGRIAIPAEYRGTTRRIRFEGTFVTGTGFLKTDTDTSAQLRVLLQERAE